MHIFSPIYILYIWTFGTGVTPESNHNLALDICIELPMTENLEALFICNHNSWINEESSRNGDYAII